MVANNANPLRAGIVGTGFAAQRRAEAIAADSRSQLVAVAGRSQESGRAFAAALPAQPTVAVLEPLALVQSADVDLVCVCSANSAHAEVVRSALDAGKHVVVEYPLALDPGAARESIALARARGVLLHVEHIELLGGLHQAIRTHLQAIAPTFYARYTTIQPQSPAPRRWTYRRDTFGFPLSGALARVRRLTDLFGRVVTVSCHSRDWDAGDGFFRANLCVARLQFASGTIAEVVYGRGEIFTRGTRAFELQGERGTLMFEGDRGTLQQGDTLSPIEIGSRRGLFARDTTAVLDYLLDGTPLYTDARDSCYALEVADVARRAAESGTTITLAT
ncbi:Gfo/Idh/MocA family protein [Rubidibacter lacunae]|uniref:Gfo/Idh/MocA family protein n=1 Tax=Rubidibacter lacunae TaxID=582514 RepID=UPI0018DE06B2|nr:Gfo/Idh/MocA family oxidoreductase [Rubidibacter lacunae]